jgi:hypothetical protein
MNKRTKMVRSTFERWIIKGENAQCKNTIKCAKTALSCWSQGRDSAAEFYLNEARSHYLRTLEQHLLGE